MNNPDAIDFKIDHDKMATVKLQLERREFVDRHQMADALRYLLQEKSAHDRDEVLSEEVLTHICSLLDDTTQNPPGPKRTPDHMRWRAVWWERMIYNHYLRLAQQRKKRGDKLAALGRKGIDNVYLDMPANEIAARLVARKFRGDEDAWHQVHNQLSSYK